MEKVFFYFTRLVALPFLLFGTVFGWLFGTFMAGFSFGYAAAFAVGSYNVDIEE
jgi:hypothetical protein